MAEQVFQIGIKALVRDEQGNVLLVREAEHADSYWDIPGGRMDAGETFMQALARELQEEIGVSFSGTPEQLDTVLSNKTISDDRGQFGLVLVVYSVTLAPDAEIMPGEEGLVTEWKTPSKAAELLNDKYPEEFCELVRALD